jgi:hypothetical protein
MEFSETSAELEIYSDVDKLCNIQDKGHNRGRKAHPLI